MAQHSFTGTVTLGVGSTLAAGFTGNGVLIWPSNTVTATFTALSAPNIAQQVVFGAQLPSFVVAVPSTATASVTFYHSNPANPLASWTGYPYPAVPVTPVAAAVSPSISSAGAPNSGASTTGESPPTSVAGSSNSSSETGRPFSDTSSSHSGYSTGVLAGVAVGCALGAALLTALLMFFCLRRRKRNARYTQKETEKQLPLLPGHGEAVYVTGNTGLEKYLPQADSDSTIRSMASRTLDQVAMHVENFYGSKSNVVLDTEHEFELESIDSSHLSEPITTILPRSSRPEDLIKHYISSYIVSMINFEDSGANGMFLPKTYRRQWQPVSQEAKSATQAYSQWRVLTAYLRQQGGDEQSYIAERNAIIDTAAGHICKAFEPWAKADKTTRFQNLVSIMKRASELGVQLFSQPGKFEWQWERPQKAPMSPAAGSRTEVAILPGLYKTTEQNAVPLVNPLRLIEPVMVAL